MDSTTLPSKTLLATEEENLHMVFSLYEVLQELPDARRAQGQRYSLALILCLVLLVLQPHLLNSLLCSTFDV